MKTSIGLILVLAIAVGRILAGPQNLDNPESKQLSEFLGDDSETGDTGSSFSFRNVLRNLVQNGESSGDNGDGFSFRDILKIFGRNDETGADSGFSFRDIFRIFRGNDEAGDENTGFSVRNLLRIFGRNGNGETDGSGFSLGNILNMFRNNGQDREESGSTFSNIFNMIPEILGRRKRRIELDNGDTIGRDTLKMVGGDEFEMADLIQNMINTRRPDIRGIFLDIYGETCCTDNCKVYAPRCMEAMKPPTKMKDYAMQCMADLFNETTTDGTNPLEMIFKGLQEGKTPLESVLSGFQEGESMVKVILGGFQEGKTPLEIISQDILRGRNPLEFVGRCTQRKFLDSLQQEYGMDNDETNIETYMLTELFNSQDVGQYGMEIFQATKTNCQMPSFTDFKIMDHIKFKMCFLKSCVGAFADK